MKKAMTALAFVFVFALHAKAGDAASGFTNGTDFAQQQLGLFDPDKPDRPGETDVFWLRAEPSNRAVITNDFAHISPLPTNCNYLAAAIDKPLERLVMPRLDYDRASNVLLKTSAYDGIYFDSHVRLLPSARPPDMDAADKIVVWLREAKAGGDFVTNLVVTAGYYAGDFKNVVSTNYVIESPSVTAGDWCRLTICAISDITGVKYPSGQFQGTKNPGFVIYIDGTQAVARADCPIGKDYDENFLTPQARVLIRERGLFPWLVPGGCDDAMTLSRFALSGRVAVDDLLFTTARPDCVPPGDVFTLKWDAGVLSMRCIVSNAVGVATNDLVSADWPGYRWDCRIGTNVNSVVTVTNVAYNVACGYTNDVWSAEGGCRLEGASFVCDGTSDNPVGRVASARDVVGVGEGVGYETFAEAKLRAMEKARAKGETTAYVALNTNWVVTAARYGAFKDGGMFAVTNGDDVVLDLNGHTLTGGSTVPTISHRGGRLRIVDSVGGGAVFPPTNSTVALRSEAYAAQGVKAGHELVIEAGRFAGEVQLTGGGKNNPFRGTCVIDGGAYTNVFGESAGFYLEQYVTNATAYYGLGPDDYWSQATNAFVWCGTGADTCWTTPENWRGGVVPGADDLAAFPRTVEPWAVDFGTGVPVKAMLMEGDVAMSGTNVFADVKLADVPPPFVSRSGRLGGTGTAIFTNALPGKLTGDSAGDGEIRLSTNGWFGTVRISGIGTATNLVDIGSWGTAGSKVEFNGVRGYLSDRIRSLTLPYELVLTDAGATPAWRNETGYAGATITFPRLSGTGTFDSPENRRPVLQTYRFEDVSGFTGRFLMGGKRLVLGAATAQGSVPGTVTFADGVCVRTGKDLGWQAVTAYFGKTLRVLGETNDVLLAYATMPEVREVTVLRTGKDGLEVTNWLAAADGQVRVVGERPAASVKMTLGAKALYVADAVGAAKAGSTLGVLPGSAVSIVGNDVMVNGWVVSSVAGYYNVSGDAQTGYSVSFDEPAVKPEVVDFAVSEGAGGIAEIVVRNARAGLWYGVGTRTTLAAEDWSAPSEWAQAEEDGELYLPVPKAGDSGGFYRVIVTDREP